MPAYNYSYPAQSMYSGYAQQVYNPMYQNVNGSVVQPGLQYPTQQQPQQRSYLSGRTVNNADEITPKDVPMDAPISLFPQNDGQIIYMKSWNANGTIDTVEYVRKEVKKVEPSNISPDVSNAIETINQRLQKIEGMLENRSKTSSRTTKENNNVSK